MNGRRVVMAEDHRLVAEGLRHLLEPEFQIVAIVEDGQSLLETATKLRPDAVVLDVSMPRLNGLEAARRLKETLPATKLVFVTMISNAAVASEAIAAGASAYVLKTAAPEELIFALRTSLRGGSHVTREIAAQMNHEQRPGTARRTLLTARQREVLQLLAEGQSMKEIGAALQVTRRTVAFHKYKMMRTLGIRTSAELVQFAVREHVVL